MNLNRLLNEIDLLYRSGIDARDTVAVLLIDYLYGTFDIVEPPIPTYPPYTWPRSVQTFE